MYLKKVNLKNKFGLIKNKKKDNIIRCSVYHPVSSVIHMKSLFLTIFGQLKK